MSKMKNFVKPVNSHLILFDQPKVAIVRGYVERVFGMLISQHIDEYDAIVTNRTILTDEELNTAGNINDNEDDSLESLHYFKSWPNLTMEDISETYRQTKGTRDIDDSFNDLKNLGCIVPEIEYPIVATIEKNESDYYLGCKELSLQNMKRGWIPCILEDLYSIQRFLKRRIVLTSSTEDDIEPSEINFMNELLENQYTHGIFGANLYSTEPFINDGVHTYGLNGTKEKMTREEFLRKFPNAYEI